MTAVGVIATFIRQHAAHVGAKVALTGEPATEEAIRIGVIGVNADFVLLEREALRSEGGPAIRRARIGIANRARAELMIHEALISLARLQRREFELGTAEPAWSFTASSALIATLQHLGIDAADLAESGPPAAWGRTPGVDFAHPGVDVRLVGSRLFARSICIPAAGGFPSMFLDETTGLPELTIQTPVPETIVAACTGRRLGELIEHPALPAVAEIVRMKRSSLGPDEVRLVIECVLCAIAQPPVSSPEWLGVGERSSEHPLFV